MIKNILIMSAVALTSVFAQAETIEILRNDHLKGNNTVRIRQVVSQQLQANGQSLNDYQLDGISLEIKARRNGTTANLLVGRDSDRKKVKKADNGLFYDLDANFTYHDMSWDLTGVEGQSNERWQMKFDDDVKVNRLYAHISLKRERIRIPMNDQFFQGATVIGIRQELKKLGYISQGMQLKRVVLVGKSRAGKAKAELVVGSSNSAKVTIPASQNGFNFQSNRPASYTRLPWTISGNTNGSWQFHMNGNIKVKAIVVDVK